jgi:hypothetical protein
VSLLPSASAVLGTLRYDSQIVEVSAELALLPAVSSFTLAVPTATPVRAAVGDPGSLVLDGGEGSATVLTGKIRAIRRSPVATRVVVADASADLAALRPAATFQRQAAREVLRTLAADVADVGTLDVDLPLAAYVAGQGRSAAEHVAELAALAEATAGFDGDGVLQVRPRPEGRPDAALRFGRELVEYEVRDEPPPDLRRVAVGSGTAGSPEAPDALRPSLDPLTAGAPDPGPGAVWRPTPVLRTPGAVSTSSGALEAGAAAGGSRIRATCFLLPALRPGAVVRVQDLPDGLSGGPWLVTRVSHRLDPRAGGSTAFEGEAAGPGAGLGSLMGTAAAAAGSLL